jgi:hypothetical protein
MVVFARNALLGASLLVLALFTSAPLRAAGMPVDACRLLTPADYKALGVTAVPKGRAADSPRQSMRACTAGSAAAKPMLSLMIQDIKMPIAVEMGRKEMASGGGEALTGPWDACTVHVGVDGTQVHFFKGNVSVLLMSSANDAAARTVLIEIAKRVAATL